MELSKVPFGKYNDQAVTKYVLTNDKPGSLTLRACSNHLRCRLRTVVRPT